MSYLLTEVALEMMGYKFYDIYGNQRPMDLQDMHNNKDEPHGPEPNLAEVLNLDLDASDEEDADDGEDLGANVSIINIDDSDTETPGEGLQFTESSQDEGAANRKAVAVESKVHSDSEAPGLPKADGLALVEPRSATIRYRQMLKPVILGTSLPDPLKSMYEEERTFVIQRLLREKDWLISQKYQALQNSTLRVEMLAECIAVHVNAMIERDIGRILKFRKVVEKKVFRLPNAEGWAKYKRLYYPDLLQNFKDTPKLVKPKQAGQSTSRGGGTVARKPVLTVAHTAPMMIITQPLNKDTMISSARPAARPTASSTVNSSANATGHTTARPTARRSVRPSASPTTGPSVIPSGRLSDGLSASPTAHTTARANVRPTARPTTRLSASPSNRTNARRSARVSASPSVSPATRIKPANKSRVGS